MISKNKHRCLTGVSLETLAEVKALDYGILIIDADECRGVDIRFQKDAIVLITARVKTYQEYLQMIGRGSRTRNVSEGILYTESTEKANVVMQRLKKSNVAMMQELEKVLHFIEQKSLHKAVIEAVSKEHANGRLILSMSDMEKTINSKHFGSIIKDVVFKRRQ